VLAAWYREVGCHLEFDVVHLIEWDLLLLDSLDRAYSRVPHDAVGLTGFTPVSDIGRDWTWLRGSENQHAWEQLRAYARDALGYEGVPHACLGIGPCFPRSFLAKYAALAPPDVGNDELRLPLFTRALGYDVVDTGFRKRWHDPEQDQFFNGDAREIKIATVKAESARADGHRVFHPARFAYRIRSIVPPG
jgi:hypothetical protein